VRTRSKLALLALTPLAAASIAHAALGDIDFQKVDVTLSKKNGRPEAPVITASNATSTWQAGNAEIVFRLRVATKVNAGSRIAQIVLGIPTIGANPRIIYQTANSGGVGREVNIDPSVRRLTAAELGIPALTAAARCAQAHANGGGGSGNFDLAFDLDVQVRVKAVRGITNNEDRWRIFDRTVPAKIHCIATSQSVAEPQRTPGAPQRVPGVPQRTPGEPQRTLSPYRPLTAELGFARAGNTPGCPVDIRQSIRIVSPGPGMAKVYILKQDNPGVLGAPVYVNVATRMPEAKYVGVLQTTVRISSTIKRTYRVLAVNPFGEPVASPWAVLDVKC
jgi:hypothetical protein